ncbi:amidase [Acuticoccus kandeliae]|uniref:amidase n=1 Tax=Acuticoccus kandeliae TaxID=2073160 RepID=UPI000D3EC2AC|nr:amidase [Acuticoccus kandeliae]
MSELTELSAVAIAEKVARRELSAEAVATAFLARTEDLNPAIVAITTINPRLLDEARAVDARLASGGAPRPLEGVPFVVKDILPTRGVRTTYGSRIFADHVPEISAICVERLEAAGGVLLGKTNTPEFATDINTTNALFGMTRNPVDLNVSTGGSSGGTGAAIAADMAPIGIGTDLGGSIRIPSAWCGIVGIRPSPGRVPIWPAEFAWDTIVAHVQGPMARTVADLGLMLKIISGQDDRDPSSLPDPTQDYAAIARAGIALEGRRIAYCESFGGLVPVDPEVAAATRKVADDLASLGAIVEPIEIDASDLKAIIAGTRGFGIVARFAEHAERHRDVMAGQLLGQVEDALKQDLRTLAHAERLRSAYWGRVRGVLEGHDFVLTPTIGAPPFRLDQPLPTTVGGKPVDRFYDVFLAAYAFTVLGLPAASVPAGFTASGLPIGAQIVGRRLREEEVLGVAARLEALHPERIARRPIDINGAVLDYTIETPGMRTT